MALILQGYMPDTYWTENFYMQDYWPEYTGPAIAMASTSQTSITPRRTTRRRMLPFDRELLNLTLEYLEMKQHVSD